jgi:heme/copper-type cytochrome/quinol oxidase subunit 2
MRNRYSALLLLALPFAVAMVPAVAHSDRTIDVTLSRSVMVPEQIVLKIGERIRLQVTSTDGAHACRVDGLHVDARIPAGGAVAADITPTHGGIFQIECINDGDAARASVKGRFVVNPER